MSKRPIKFTLFIALLGSVSIFGNSAGSDSQVDGSGRRTMSALKAVVEVRDRIHRLHVDMIDSTSLVEGAIDGMVSVLPQGDNLFVSAADMAMDSPAADNRGQLNLLSEAYRQIYRSFLTPVVPDTLSKGAIWGMLATLDPHSSFVEPIDVSQMMERFRGDFEGIGIYFEVRHGRLLVISPILGSPSDGKLRAGDQITMIDGIPTEGITTEQVMKKLRGPKGTTVDVSVERKGEEEWLEQTILRDRIKVSSVPYAYIIEPGTGYVRITRFTETTGQGLAAAIQKLRSQGLRRLLLDLRQNGGGLLSQAVEVADQFIDRGELIVYTEGRNPHERQNYRAATPLTEERLPLIILLDHGSASASEIVAGAIQDLDRGLIVGQTSFGKGLVQEQFRLSDGAGLLLLTVARYYTPLGRLIQRPYTEDLQAYIHGGIDDVDPNSVDSLRSSKKRFRTASGRVVYGGGGITPDTTLVREEYSSFMRRLFAKAALFDFAIDWVGSREVWSGDFPSYLSNYSAPDSALVEFGRYLAEKEIVVEEGALHTDGELLKREIKAEFVRVLWGDEARYRVKLEGDAQAQQALPLFGEAEELLADTRLRN